MSDLSSLQESIEERALSKGIEAYWQGINDQRSRGDAETLQPAQSLIASHIEPVANLLSTWCGTLDSLRPHSLEAHAIVAIQQVGMQKAAALGLIALMRMLPRLPLPKASLCMSIGSNVLGEHAIALAADKEPALISHAIRDVTKRGANDAHRAKVLKALSKATLKSTGHNTKIAFQIGFGVLNCILRGTDLFEMRHMVKEGTHHVAHFVDVRGAVSDWIEYTLGQREECGVRYPVMVVPPRQWMPGISGGYRFALADKLELFGRARGSRIDQTTFDALNHIQSVPWQINRPVYDTLRELIFARTAVAGLAATNVEEDTKPVFPEDRADDADAVKAWKRQARDWHYSRAQAVSAAATAAAMVVEADGVRKVPAIYFPHRLDFRTRVYAATSALSTQGADQQKGVLRFSRGQPIGDAADWLAIHGANCMGACPMSGAKLDKAPFAERIAWVHRNHNLISTIAADWRGSLDLWSTADSPFQFLAFCQEWAGYMAEGAAFETHLPIAVDGSCNGLQHYAALMKDPTTAKAVNLLPSDSPADVYADVAAAFVAHLMALAEGGDERASFWLGSGQIDRPLCKRPVMTLSYGVSQFGVLQQLREELDGRGFDYGGPKNVSWLAAEFYRTLYQSVPAAMQAMDWLQRAARAIASEGKPVMWSNLIGSRVRQNTPKRMLEVLRLYFMKQPIGLGLRKDGKPDPRAAANSIAPNIIHSFDAAHLIAVVNRLREEGVRNVHVIHDSFGVAAPDVPTLNRALRDTFVELYEGDIWSALAADLASQTLADLPAPPGTGSLDLSQVRQSAYFFA